MQTIDTTLGVCLDAEPSLTRLAAHPWPVKTAYHLAKLVRLVRDEARAFEEQRIALVKTLGTPRAPTEVELARGIREEVVEVAADRMKDYVQQYGELRSTPTTIFWGPLTLEMLTAQPREIPAADLIDLGPFFSDGTPGAALAAVEPLAPPIPFPANA